MKTHFHFSLVCLKYLLNLCQRYYFSNTKLHKNVKLCGNQKLYQVVSVYYSSSSGDSVVSIKVSGLIRGHLTWRSNHMRTQVCWLPNCALANGTAQFAQFLSKPYLRSLLQFFNKYISNRSTEIRCISTILLNSIENDYTPFRDQGITNVWAIFHIWFLLITWLLGFRYITAKAVVTLYFSL